MHNLSMIANGHVLINHPANCTATDRGALKPGRGIRTCIYINIYIYIRVRTYTIMLPLYINDYSHDFPI